MATVLPLQVLTFLYCQLSEFRHQQILARGQPELDSLLGEIRTLAQLDHPNIVRYYNGWLDYIQLSTSNLLTPAGEPDPKLGAPDNRLSDGISFGRVSTESDDQADNVLFEDSISQATTKSSASTGGNNSEDLNALHRTASRGTRATVSDEDVESISRASEPSFSVSLHTECSMHASGPVWTAKTRTAIIVLNARHIY